MGVPAGPASDPHGAQSYVERLAPPALRDVVASTWVQRVDGQPLAHRDLPTGSVEVRCRVGSVPEVVGPLTRARLDVLMPGTVVVGLRLHPDAAARVLSRPASELADRVVRADELWSLRGSRLSREVEDAPTPGAVIARLLQHVGASPAASPRDPLVAAAVRELRWLPGEVGGVATALHVSERQLRRRVLAHVGLAPKTLHRAFRFQRFVALAQAAIAGGRSPAGGGLARLAAEAGYADQAHLTRECARLTGVTPAAYLRAAVATCSCGHDHAAAYLPLLQSRGSRPRAA